MPDIGGIGRGLLKGALSATEKAAEKVKDAAGAASRKVSGDDRKLGDDAAAPQAATPVAVAEPDGGEVADAPTGDPQPAGVDASPKGPTGDSQPADVDAPPKGPTGDPQPAGADAPPKGDPTSDDAPDESERADESDVREFVEMFQQLLAKRRPPEGPIQGEWSFGVGDLLAEHPKVPKRVRGLVTKLNHFGGIAYSPEEVTFDGDDVPWTKATEVRTRHIVDYLVGDAVQQQVENLPLPWFPGRQRLLDALGQALLTVTIATAKDQLDRLDLDVRIPAEVAYKASFGRTKELGAGVVSALVLADPAVNRSFVATAQARGITVTQGDDEMLATAEERAAQLREKVKALETELDRFTKRFARKDERTTDG